MSPAATPPVLDARTYQDLVDEALARIPIHNPEWTNFNRSDPGVTLIELFAFLTESLLYRANQIPERNRRAFLSLLGVPLMPGASARGLVTISNASGAQETLTLPADLELRAGQLPFRTATGMDLLPVETRAYFKRELTDVPAAMRAHYKNLYASYAASTQDADALKLYETVELQDPLAQQSQPGLDLAETVDRSLWIAVLLRRQDGSGETALNAARDALANRTLSLGIVPVFDDPDAVLTPLGRGAGDAVARLDYQIPKVTQSLGERVTSYRSLEATAAVNVLEHPGIVQLALPGAGDLRTWADIEPIEDGVGDLPPAFDDTKLAERVITWLRIQAAPGADARLLWAGINAVEVTQQTRVVGEVLPRGTGTPDQAARLSHAPVLPATVRLRVDDPPVEWARVDDLYTAGPEVPVADPRRAPGAQQPDPAPADVYALDAASGIVRFGDGLHGRRPPEDAAIRVDYAYGAGAAGNVGPGTITTAAALPAGVKVTNPVRTWGGAQAETVAEGEKQIARHLRHRDRLVSAEDFDTIVRRTPGVDVGRVDVIPAFSPELAPSLPGDAPGAVTLMLIPRVDALHPDAPVPDQPFLDAVCAYIDPRRLVTTEVFLRGPTYKPIWLSVGFTAVAGQSIAAVRDATKAALKRFLAPLGSEQDAGAFAHAAGGWPRLKPVVALELLAVASRVPGVDMINGLLVGAGDESAAAGGGDPIAMRGLELPYVAGIMVQAGEPMALDQLRGLSPSPQAPPKSSVPVPVIPETC
jgi:hypothetical protein